jgi:hypothetical protein
LHYRLSVFGAAGELVRTGIECDSFDVPRKDVDHSLSFGAHIALLKDVVRTFE